MTHIFYVWFLASEAAKLELDPYNFTIYRLIRLSGDWFARKLISHKIEKSRSK